MEDLVEIKKLCLQMLLRLYKSANAGHIASSLSCLDILVYLFFYKMDKDSQTILSKGHAAAALYVVLAKFGKISENLLSSFCKDGTLLAAHPPCGGGGGSPLERAVWGMDSLWRPV
jgi:transketolase